jgi:hypothetical protein
MALYVKRTAGGSGTQNAAKRAQKKRLPRGGKKEAENDGGKYGKVLAFCW